MARQQPQRRRRRAVRPDGPAQPGPADAADAADAAHHRQADAHHPHRGALAHGPGDPHHRRLAAHVVHAADHRADHAPDAAPDAGQADDAEADVTHHAAAAHVGTHHDHPRDDDGQRWRRRRRRGQRVAPAGFAALCPVQQSRSRMRTRSGPIVND